MPKPRVITACPANRYTSRDERIIEFSFPGTDAGGLIAFRGPLANRLGDPIRPTVEVYRTDGAVRVIAPETPRHALYMGNKHGHLGISVHATLRDALLAALETVNEDDEMILNDEKIGALADDTLGEYVTDYAAARGFDFYIEAVTL
jgi:hypothetical protein